MKEHIKLFVCLIFCSVSFGNLFGQTLIQEPTSTIQIIEEPIREPIDGPTPIEENYHIEGPTIVNVGETKSYSVKDAYGRSPYGGSFRWSAYGGLITANNSSYYEANNVYSINVNWTNPGSRSISVDFQDDFYNYYFSNLSVTVLGTLPDDPNNPNFNGNVCSPSVTRSGTPPTGVTWYWQGKDANGTNTNKGYGTTYIPSEGEGTYYIRARTSSGVWSAGSGSVEVITISAPLWYTDADNDGLGDPASIPIASCTKPTISLMYH